MADGLILTGGVAKGAFGAGALSVLATECDTDIRRVVATSSGAVNGVHFASALRRGDERAAAHELAEIWIEHATFGEVFDVNPWCPETRRRRFSHDFAANRRLEDAAARGQSGRDPMLPATLQFIIAMIAYALNERMAGGSTTCRRRFGFSRRLLRRRRARPGST